MPRYAVEIAALMPVFVRFETEALNREEVEQIDFDIEHLELEAWEKNGELEITQWEIQEIQEP